MATTVGGSEGNDYIYWKNAGAYEFYGFAGDDIIRDSVRTSRSGSQDEGDIYHGGDGNDNLRGGRLGDTLFGDAGDDVVYGQDGDDSLDGGVGDDLLNGGNDNDTMNGGAGNDTLIGGFGDETMTGGDGNDLFTTSQGNHVVDGGAGDDEIVASNGDDELMGSSGNDQIVASSGNDTIDAGDDNDDVLAGAGDDLVAGGAGNDTLDGQDGRDTVVYTNEASAVRVDLTAGQAVDRSTGGSVFTDIVVNFENASGSAFDDKLIGTIGNNILEGGAGDNTLIGGDGSDTASYTTSNTSVTVNLSTNQATHNGSNTDTLDGIENAIGSDFADQLIGSSDSNRLQGGGGDDTLDGGSDNGRIIDNAVVGGDTLLGDAGTDTVTYSQENQAVFVDLRSSIAYDRSTQGTTEDGFVDVLDSIENMIGSDSDDDLRGTDAGSTDGANFIDAGAGADVVFGRLGDDTLHGGDGDDQLSGGDGDDILRGGRDNGRIINNAVVGGDTLLGDAGTDTADYGQETQGVFVDLRSSVAYDRSTQGGTDEGFVDSLLSIENLIGSGFADDLRGTDTGSTNGANRIDAGAGNDVVFGRLGNDTLIGGAGSDQLDGGDGIDTADYSQETEAVFIALRSSAVVDRATSGGRFGDVVQNIENFIGSNFSDIIDDSTTAVSNRYEGGLGNDQIQARNGSDTMLGGDGNDFLLALSGGSSVHSSFGEAGIDEFRTYLGVAEHRIFDWEDGERILVQGGGAISFVFTGRFEPTGTYAALVTQSNGGRTYIDTGETTQSAGAAVYFDIVDDIFGF